MIYILCKTDVTSFFEKTSDNVIKKNLYKKYIELFMINQINNIITHESIHIRLKSILGGICKKNVQRQSHWPKK